MENVGVVCEKLQSIFKMHARLNFSLLQCHCFEKSKLCLQKLHVCIHMYESIQLSRDETAEHNSRFCWEKEAEANSKIHFLTQVEWGSFRHTLLRGVLTDPWEMWRRRLHFCWICLFPSIPLVQAAFIYLLGLWLPNLVFFPPVVFKCGDFAPQGIFLLSSQRGGCYWHLVNTGPRWWYGPCHHQRTL